MPAHQPETYSVSDLCEEIRDTLALTFPPVWVVGEVQRPRRPRSGHLYFELVEKGSGDTILGKLDAVIWRTHHQVVARLLGATGQKIDDGQLIRCRGRLDFYGPHGRIQLSVREVDPLFAMGHLEKRRRETLEALAKSGLLDRNKGLELTPVPLTVALISSVDSAGFEDFVSTLRGSGFGFRVLALHATVQGAAAEREVSRALARLDELDVDCAVLVRGGGARADLAAFDSRRIAEAVARAPVPVLTGLGHEIDRSIADEVAHTACRTPTKVAELLIERVSQSFGALGQLQRDLLHASTGLLRLRRAALATAERSMTVARLRLSSERGRLERLATAMSAASQARLRADERAVTTVRRDLSRAVPRRLYGAEAERRGAATRLTVSASGHVRAQLEALEGRERLLRQLAPERTLARGFSITRDAAGQVLRGTEVVAAGDPIETQLAAGRLVSRVEET